MGTDRLNLLKLSVRVGLGCKSSMCGWCVCAMDVQCVSVCLHSTYGFVSTVCMQGLCGSSGCTVTIMWSVRYNMCSVCELSVQLRHIELN